MGDDATPRHPRWIHRHGVLFTAVLRPPTTGPADPAAVTGELPALARLSLTFGWPRLPDYVGLGVRVDDWPRTPDADETGRRGRPVPTRPRRGRPTATAHGGGRSEVGGLGGGPRAEVGPRATAEALDLLLVSSGAPTAGLRRFGSTRDVLACTFTSRVGIPIAGELRTVAAVPTEERSSTLAALGDGSGACPVTYRLMTSAASAPEEWAHLGELTLTAPAVAESGLALRPPTRGPAPFTGFRRRVYDWAQRHR